MSHLNITFAALSDVGRTRTNNEDSFQIKNLENGASFGSSPSEGVFRVQGRGALLALSDGMGGHAAGEVASAVAIDALGKALESRLAGATEQRFEAAIRAANAEVAATAEKENHHGMGATLTAVLVDESGAYVAEVGDSRAYLLRSGRLKQLTHDQNLAQMLVDQGLCSKQEADESPHKNMLLQAMGVTPEIHAAIGYISLRQRDKMLLCSDGISNAISDDELRETLENNEPAGACAKLVQLANDRGGEDNLTAVVAIFDDSRLACPSPTETVTATFKVLKDFGQSANRQHLLEYYLEDAAD
jgi:serine/threonine protein phosphatase PrpC